jgi:hypothetical protein
VYLLDFIIFNADYRYVINTVTRWHYRMKELTAQLSIEKSDENPFTIVGDVPKHEFINFPICVPVLPCDQSPSESRYFVDTKTRLHYRMQEHPAQLSIEKSDENTFTIVQDVPKHGFSNFPNFIPELSHQF